MATKKPAKKRKKKKQAARDCVNPGNPNNGGNPYNLAEILVELKNKDFAKFFFDLIKRAQANEEGAIDCLNVVPGADEGGTGESGYTRVPN